MSHRARNMAQKGEILFTFSELDWFCKNSYNLALRSIEEWDENISQRLLDCCLEVFSLFWDSNGIFANFLVHQSLSFWHRCEQEARDSHPKHVLPLFDFLPQHRDSAYGRWNHCIWRTVPKCAKAGASLREVVGWHRTTSAALQGRQRGIDGEVFNNAHTWFWGGASTIRMG